MANFVPSDEILYSLRTIRINIYLYLFPAVSNDFVWWIMPKATEFDLELRDLGKLCQALAFKLQNLILREYKVIQNRIILQIFNRKLAKNS